MAFRPSENGGRRVIVRLSDVPLHLRMAVADELMRRYGLRGTDAAELHLAAWEPSSHVQLAVPSEKAERALSGKRPIGNTPKGYW